MYHVQPQIEQRVWTDALPQLSKIKAFRNLVCSNYLEFQDVHYLEHELEGIADSIIARYGSKQYEEGMVRKVNEMIEDILANFETHVVRNKLRIDFKWAATVFGLIKFTRVMHNNEKEWNE